MRLVMKIWVHSAIHLNQFINCIEQAINHGIIKHNNYDSQELTSIVTPITPSTPVPIKTALYTTHN